MRLFAQETSRVIWSYEQSKRSLLVLISGVGLIPRLCGQDRKIFFQRYQRIEMTSFRIWIFNRIFVGKVEQHKQIFQSPSAKGRQGEHQTWLHHLHLGALYFALKFEMSSLRFIAGGFTFSVNFFQSSAALVFNFFLWLAATLLFRTQQLFLFGISFWLWIVQGCIYVWALICPLQGDLPPTWNPVFSQLCWPPYSALT